MFFAKEMGVVGKAVRIVAVGCGLVAVLLLAGCDFVEFGLNEKAVRLCEEKLISGLKSPSSYDRASVRVSYDPGTEWGDVSISYDAANSYGALMRGTHECAFRRTKGWTTLGDPDGAAKARDAAMANYINAKAASEAAVDEAMAAAEKAARVARDLDRRDPLDEPAMQLDDQTTQDGVLADTE